MAFFAIIYALISLVNHYTFRTYALDLGLHNHALYDYSHFRFNYSLILQPLFEPRNQLSDHFDLMVILLSPLVWIFGSWTLLIVQIAAILFGGFGIYKYFKNKTTNPSLPLLAMFHFYSIWGIYSALSFDYHSNVMAAMFMPWYIYFFDKKDWNKTILFFILMIICKEITGLWLFFINIGLLIHYRKQKEYRIKSLLFSIIAIAYFYSMIRFIIPALSPSGNNYIHFSFDALGKTPEDSINAVLRRFQYVISLLFESPNQGYFAIKTELHFYVLLSGGFALFYKPQFALMLISIYAQKLFHSDPTKWGINYHYSIEFVPVITLALFTWLCEKNINSNKQKRLAFIFTAISFVAGIASLDHRYSVYYDRSQACFFDDRHYKQPFNLTEIHRAINKIPALAKVSAGASLVPHLAMRDSIFCYPYIGNSDFIVLLKKGGSTFPQYPKEFKKSLLELSKDSMYVKVFDENELLIYQNKKYQQVLNFK